MNSFDTLWKRAARRCGGPQALGRLLSTLSDDSDLTAKRDNQCLATLTQCIFETGFSPIVIHRKWPGFLDACHDFNPPELLALSEHDWHTLEQDPRIVRNPAKIKSIRKNAAMVANFSAQYGSFALFLAQWPTDNLVGLFDCFNVHGQRIGANTAQRFLRRIGKDCFALSPEVIAALQHEGLNVAQTPARKKELAAIQAAFNEWHRQSGLSYLHLSEVLALSLNPATHEEPSPYVITTNGWTAIRIRS